MKIVVIVRTRNEERRIWNFCKAYRDVDKILVADGGSVDNTIKIAESFANVEVRHYTKRVQLKNGYWRNNDSDHTNFLIAWAKEYNPDWIISDDCDCRPNKFLKNDYRWILEHTTNDFIMVTRLYLWDDTQHFVHMAKPGKDHRDYEPSLWAWRGNQDFWTVDDNFPHFTFRIGDTSIKDLHSQAKTLDLFPPYCLLHTSWVDKEHLDNKLREHRDGGSIPNIKYPSEYAGPLELLESWMVE